MNVITIEKIDVHSTVAYVHLKILSTQKADENYSAFFCTKNLDTNKTLITNDKLYWFDRYNSSINTANNISVRRNLNIILKFNLLDGIIVNDSFILNIKLQLKRHITHTPSDETIWESNNLVLASEKITKPKIKLDYVSSGESKSKFKFTIKHKTASDKKIFEQFIKPRLYILDTSGTRVLDVINTYNINNELIFESPETFEASTIRVKLSLNFINGNVFSQSIHETEVASNALYHYAGEVVTARCVGFSETSTHKKVKLFPKGG